MRVALIGPEIEENLGLRCIHASLVRAGHEARIFDFQSLDQTGSIAEDVVGWGPDVVGLSLVFTGRAREFVELAGKIREGGFQGHLTAGGHFATFHARELLERFTFMDSIVHGEGEEIIVDLVAHLDDLGQVGGLSFRDGDGRIVRNASRRHPDNLDLKAPPTRSKHMRSWLGLPVAGMLGSRGCLGKCTYCSIQAWFRENPGKRLRQRSVELIAEEMAGLYHGRGVRIFGFHDDNFLVASKRRNMERFRSLERRLGEHGVGRIALQIKVRPDGVEPETFELLGRMGLFRVFLGIESNAQAGLDTLGRGVDRKVNHVALTTLRELGVHTCFNLLMFDPDSTLEQIGQNIAFMRRWPFIPMNFGRVEVYSGTPLERTLRDQGRLRGDIFGYHYRIRDERAQGAFEMFSRIFLPRNFGADGLASVSMKVDYLGHLLGHFHPDRVDGSLENRVSGLVGELNLSSADILGRICEFLSADPVPGAEEILQESARLAGVRERFDERYVPRFEALVEEIEATAARKPRAGAGILARAASAAAVAVVVGVGGCKQPSGEQETPPVPHGVEEVEKPAEEEKPAKEPLTVVEDASTSDPVDEAVEDAEAKAVPPPAPPPKKKVKKKRPKRPHKGLPPDYNEMMMYPMGLDDD